MVVSEVILIIQGDVGFVDCYFVGLFLVFRSQAFFFFRASCLYECDPFPFLLFFREIPYLQPLKPLLE